MICVALGLHDRTCLLSASTSMNQRVCDGFRDFFLDKICKIATTIKDVITSGTLPSPLPLVHPQSTNLSHFAYIVDDDVIRAIQDIPCKTSAMDNIPTTVLKSAADVVRTRRRRIS